MRLMTLRQLFNQPDGTLAVDTESGMAYRVDDGKLFALAPNATALRLDVEDLDLDKEFQTKVVWFPEDD